MGRIDPTNPITLPVMRETKLVTKIGDGVKLLADVSCYGSNEYCVYCCCY